MSTFDCPHCGAPVPINARMCRECGADAECGWEVPQDDFGWEAEEGADDDFDYDEFVRREFPEHASGPPRGGDGRPGFWGAVVLFLVLISLLLSMLA